MARRKSPNLTEGELRLMKVLWAKGPATVGDVVESLPPEPPVAYNTVLTLLRILEKKGFVRHTKDGRAFVYEPLVGSKEASSNAIRHLVSRFFGGSTGQLVMKLLEEEQIDARELKRIKKRINENE
ncbi:MAG TPA: BlaI/MecI/CopY family transcriptional regulator [Tepidisphaeraceae bacterium]|nr:BlaI/MecI/CopY family transcriptional regulator [Tepidisphaeraceae bacterium]